MRFSDSNFDLATLTIVHRVLDAAWSDFKYARLATAADAIALRKVMAKRLMAEARLGELNPDRLKVLALDAAADHSLEP